MTNLFIAFRQPACGHCKESESVTTVICSLLGRAAGEQPLFKSFPCSSCYQHVQSSEMTSGDYQEGNGFGRQASQLRFAMSQRRFNRSKSSLKGWEASQQPGLSLQLLVNGVSEHWDLQKHRHRRPSQCAWLSSAPTNKHPSNMFSLLPILVVLNCQCAMSVEQTL